MADLTDTYPTLTPYLVVPDADAEIRFLQSAFEATEVSCQRNADATVMHAEFRVGDSLIMLGQASETSKAIAAALYLMGSRHGFPTWVPDRVPHVDATHASALKAGATSESAPEDKPYGQRMAGVVDPSVPAGT